MKKIICVVLCAVLSACALAGCSKGGNSQKSKDADNLFPSESVNYDKLTPIYEFAGTYKNDDYTVVVELESDQILKFTVTTNKNKDGRVDEWQMTGYFSDQTYRVNYNQAVKYTVDFDENGEEKQRTAEYENGSGRMQFAEGNKLFWEHDTQKLEGNTELTKTKD